MRKSALFALVTALNLALFILLLLHSRVAGDAGQRPVQASADMVRSLGLTDLCLFTEARYTRHPAMADLHTPFQDHPLALEHFPSGSLISPPPIVMRSYE